MSRGGVLDVVLCDGNMVKDTPRVIPPGEFGFEGHSPVDKDGFRN